MKINKRVKVSPKGRRPQAPSSRLSTRKTPVPAPGNLQGPLRRAPAAPSLFSRYVRALTAGGALLLGGYLIETHPTYYHTLAGLALWAVAVSLSLEWFPRVPGAGIFPMLAAPEAKEGRDWRLWKIALVSGGALAALGLSNYFLGQARVWFLLFSLLALGWCLTLLEGRFPQALGGKRLEPAPSHRAGFPWAVAVILLVGSFFLFYGWDLFPLGYDADSQMTLNLADNIGPAGQTTPYIDGWMLGDPLFPFFLMGVFLKAVGCTFQNGDLFIAFLNLAGYLFFYGFVRFYLPKAPALAATLFLCSSHWVLYQAREISGVWGMLIPLECATLYFFARALEKGQARDYALFGTLVAFTLLSNILGWALLFFFLLVLSAFLVWRKSALLNQKKSWVLALLVAFLWYLPMMIFYYRKGYTSCFPIFWFKKDVYLQQGTKFFIPWSNFRDALQMFNIGSRENLMDYLPLLSSWEGLFLLAGLGWCLRRFFKPSSLFIILGLLAGLSAVFLKNEKHTYGALPAAPFVFLLVGIGLDRLTMVLAAPLGHRGSALRLLLGVGFLALGVGWQYDIFFNHLPRFNEPNWRDFGRSYLYGTITAKHLEGWDTYVDLWDGTYQLEHRAYQLPDGTWQHPTNDFYYSISEMEKGQRIIFRPDQSSLPLKSIPQKGALILLPDHMGKAFQDWINYYYPAVQEKEILDPYGDVEYRFWEITPDQIQNALKGPAGPPPGGLVLSWFDAQNRPLGKWVIPTLSSNNQEWFDTSPDKLPVPMDKVAYFTVRGNLQNASGKTIAIETSGKAQGMIDGQKFLVDGAGVMKRVEIRPVTKGNAPFVIHYTVTKGNSFDLNLFEHTPLGWDMIPSSELKL